MALLMGSMKKRGGVLRSFSCLWLGPCGWWSPALAEVQARQRTAAACEVMLNDSPGLRPPAGQIEARWELEGS